MKFTTSLFGMIAFAIFFLALGVSASNDVSISNDSLDVSASNDVSETKAPVSPIFDPDMNHLYLEGLDPSVPLTQNEAAYLSSAIQGVFDELHQAAGIDLYADSVAVGTHAHFNASFFENLTDDDGNSTSSLRGGRKLERGGMRGKPTEDWNWCHYRSGPKKGEWIPGCEFDINLYVCCRCWMCFDDDFTVGWSWRPTKAPTPPPTLSFHDKVKFYSDDDYYDRTQKPTKKPTRKPADLEKERGPEEPFIHPKPPSSSPPRRRKKKNNNKKNNNNNKKEFDKEVLNKLKNSPFHRFHEVKKVRFGYGN